MKTPKMYLMSGPSGAGKTMFAKQFIAGSQSPIQYLGVDDFYRVYNGDSKLHEDEFDVWMSFWRAIHVAEQKGRDILVDTNAPTYVDRRQFINWFPGFTHILLFVRAPLELCLENNRKRDRVLPDDVVVQLHESVENIGKELQEHGWNKIIIIKNSDNIFKRHEIDLA